MRLRWGSGIDSTERFPRVIKPDARITDIVQTLADPGAPACDLPRAPLRPVTIPNTQFSITGSIDRVDLRDKRFCSARDRLQDGGTPKGAGEHCH